MTSKEGEEVVPMRSAVVRDEDGVTCTTTEAQNERWRRHFYKILTVQSEFDLEELGRVKHRPLTPDLAELPTEEELMRATEKLKSGKAGGIPADGMARHVGYGRFVREAFDTRVLMLL